MEYKVTELLPQRPPMLMIDRILSLEPCKSCTALKNVSASEPCLTGHFPGEPILPGVYTIEALAQTASLVLLAVSDDDKKKPLPIFAGIQNARFSRMITPGDTVTLSAVLDHTKGKMNFFNAEAKVGDETACTAELVIALVQK